MRPETFGMDGSAFRVCLTTTSNVRWPVEQVLEFQRTRVGLWSKKDLIFTPFSRSYGSGGIRI